MINFTAVKVTQRLILIVFFFENLAQVSEEANAKLSKALSLEEFNKALTSMESGKVPGIDSLPLDFLSLVFLDNFEGRPARSTQ